MAITKDQIFAVADDLDAAGQNPTLAAVRKALGSGSFTTISEGMNEWRARKTAEIAAPIREPAPQAVSDRLMAFGTDLWGVALDMANGRLEAQGHALEAERVKLENKVREAAEMADSLNMELEEARARIGGMEATAATSEAEAEELRSKLADANGRAAIAEARADELRTELDQAHREAAMVRADLKTQAERLQTAVAECAAAKVTITEGERRADELRMKLEKAETYVRGVEDRANELQRLLHEATAKTQRVDAELATVKTIAERVTKIEVERDALRVEAATLRGRLGTLETVLTLNEKGKTGAGGQKKS